MEKDYYSFKIFCDLGITSSEISVEEITEKLGTSPHRFFRKGEEFCSKISKTKGKRMYNLWAIESSAKILKYENIKPAIKELKNMLRGKEKMLLELKDDKRCEVTLTVWIETDDAGIGLDVEKYEMDFFNFVTRVHFTFIPNNVIHS